MEKMYIYSLKTPPKQLQIKNPGIYDSKKSGGRRLKKTVLGGRIQTEGG